MEVGLYRDSQPRKNTRALTGQQHRALGLGLKGNRDIEGGKMESIFYFGEKRESSEKISENVKTKQQCQGCKTLFYYL